ncbi:MAG: hypothetical protein AB1465_04035 [Patescibacteria group bacterium]
MAKSKQRIKAEKLRKRGLSLNEIYRALRISKSTASLWCRNIKLGKKQIERLMRREKVGSYIGRLKGAKILQKKREEEIKKYQEEGLKTINRLNNREFLIAGLCVYWGEGFKTAPSHTGISNSDPQVITFIIKWFKKFFNIDNSQFRFQIGLNEYHKYRSNKVLNYWSNLIKFPKSQFGKISYKKVKFKKVYKNPESYFGTLRVKIKKSIKTQRKILGLINAISKAA